MWKGTITFGSFALPVKLYSAVQDKKVHFRLLDASTELPVRQHMVDADSGDVVDSAHVRKALQVSARRMVVLEEGELEEAEPADAREIDVGRFVPAGSIAHQWFERPYWLGPDGDASKYFALVRALREEEREGFARWVMRKRSYAGALRVSGDWLMLNTLRFNEQVVEASRLKGPGGREPLAREVEMAHKLIESMEGELDMTQFRDTYREAVHELAQAKAKGKVVKFPRAKSKPASEGSLEALLERSLGGAKRGRKSA